MRRCMLTTEDHKQPRPPDEAQGAPALVVAFPHSMALLVPPSRRDLGRAWLEAAGLNDAKVSRTHLRFTRAGGVLQVEDLGSRHGTYLDGVRLPANQPTRVSDGATLRLGNTLMVYREHLKPGTSADPLAPDPRLGGPQGLVGPYGLRDVAHKLEHLKRHPTRNVLILGSTGAGKELLARAVHDALRPKQRYAPINMTGITATMFEAQLFGYVPGAYSGAGKGSPGLVREQQGGTVFLDELGELPLELQPKLLRLLENREVLPVGGTQPVSVDVLIIAATNQDLVKLQAEQKFREDLYWRFAGSELQLPSLSQRPEDVFAIASAISPAGQPYIPDDVEAQAVEALMLHPFPGNVRELAGVLKVAAQHDPPPGLTLRGVQAALTLRGASAAAPSARAQAQSRPAPLTPATVERALAQTSGNQSQAARLLGVDRGALLRFLKAKQAP